MLWISLVLLTITVGIATIWFAYALLIQRRISARDIPEHWWHDAPLGRLLLQAQADPEIHASILGRDWTKLESFGLFEEDRQFLDECDREDLALILDLAPQSIGTEPMN